MTAALRTLWLARAPRERRWLAIAAAVLGVALYGALLWSATLARAPLLADVATLRGQAARLQQQALELGQLQGRPAPSVSATDLRGLVQSRLDGTRLGQGLQSLEIADAEHVVVVFGAVGFADWLQWLEDLQTLQLRVESCRIEALATPGMVAVTVTLVRAAPP